jgi:hypothetical protein
MLNCPFDVADKSTVAVKVFCFRICHRAAGKGRQPC